MRLLQSDGAINLRGVATRPREVRRGGAWKGASSGAQIQAPLGSHIARGGGAGASGARILIQGARVEEFYESWHMCALRQGRSLWYPGARSHCRGGACLLTIPALLPSPEHHGPYVFFFSAFYVVCLLVFH